tara:strand:- start:662 stop:877 length:216 start_codon:yes stop_codon:yes gene_type:complete
MDIGTKIYDFVTYTLYLPLKNLFIKISGAESPGYGEAVLARLVVYGAIACILASLLGVKKKIDKLFSWAQL